MTHAILCGTQYGSSYIPALSDDSSPLRLAAIVSRGSEKSRKMAMQMQVPHFTSLEAISPEQASTAIVAVSGNAGVQLARTALTLGFNVLAEHPWEPDQIASIYELANEARRTFHINGHWADQLFAREFINGCHVAARSNQAVFASMITNPRTLYSGLDILTRALGPIEIESFEVLTRKDPDERTPFVVLQGLIDGTLTTIQYQTFTSEIDDGTNALANHHIVIGYPQGHLTLAETVTPAIWVPDMMSLYAMGPAGQQQAAATLFPQEQSPSVAEFNLAHRKDANITALQHLVDHAETGICPAHQTPEYHNNLASGWRHMMNIAGPISFR